MFSKKTVLVIGAGASSEVNLPVGSDLLRAISRALDIRYENGIRQKSGCPRMDGAYRALARRRGETNINPLLHKGRRIVEAAKQGLSIDYIVDQHDGDEDLQLIAKMAIARQILDAERASTLFEARGEQEGSFDVAQCANTWFVRFAQKLMENVRPSMLDGIFDNVTIVSFNYDRCLEHFLVQSLMVSYGIKRAVAQGLVARLRIFHPYGQVGKLPWMPGTGPSVAFGQEEVDLEGIAGQIRTFTERIDDTATLLAMRQAVQEAPHLVFLGFAFHPQNLRLLECAGASKTRAVFATTYGISDPQQASIIEDLNEMLRRPERPGMSTPSFNFHAQKCAALFDHFWRNLN